MIAVIKAFLFVLEVEDFLVGDLFVGLSNDATEKHVFEVRVLVLFLLIPARLSIVR